LDTFEKEGVEVDRAGSDCTQSYVLYNVKLGKSLSVTIRGPLGERRARASKIDELSGIYSQMVRSLLSGKPMSTDSNAMDRSNVTSVQMAPKRVQADSLWYVKLGYGGTIGNEFHGGPLFGVGYRYELDKLGIDVSFANFKVSLDKKNQATSDGDGGVSGSWVKLMAVYFFKPKANSTLYVEGGLSWGGAAVSEDGRNYSNNGLQGELGVGYELLRASTIRLFCGLEATLPFYMVYSEGKSVYAPSLGLTLGVGWGGNNVLRVVE
jgi:hypothetical protein